VADTAGIDQWCTRHGLYRPEVCLLRLVETWGVLDMASVNLECAWQGLYRSGICLARHIYTWCVLRLGLYRPRVCLYRPGCVLGMIHELLLLQIFITCTEVNAINTPN